MFTAAAAAIFSFLKLWKFVYVLFHASIHHKLKAIYFLGFAKIFVKLHLVAIHSLKTASSRGKKLYLNSCCRMIEVDY